MVRWTGQVGLGKQNGKNAKYSGSGRDVLNNVIYLVIVFHFTRTTIAAHVVVLAPSDA